MNITIKKYERTRIEKVVSWLLVAVSTSNVVRGVLAMNRVERQQRQEARERGRQAEDVYCNGASNYMNPECPAYGTMQQHGPHWFRPLVGVKR